MGDEARYRVTLADVAGGEQQFVSERVAGEDRGFGGQRGVPGCEEQIVEVAPRRAKGCEGLGRAPALESEDLLETDRKPDGALRQDNVMRYVIATK